MQTLTIAVIGQKGGVGKSTTTQNLAAEAHLRGAKVLVRDADQQGTSYTWFCTRTPESRLRGLRVEHAFKQPDWNVRRYREVTEGHDYVFIDTSASLGEITNMAAIVADVAVVPIKPLAAEEWATNATKQLLDDADAQRAQFGIPPLRRVMFFNEVRPSTKDAKLCRQKLEPMKLGLVEAQWTQRVAFHRTMRMGETVHAAEEDAGARAEVERLFAAVMAVAS